VSVNAAAAFNAANNVNLAPPFNSANQAGVIANAAFTVANAAFDTANARVSSVTGTSGRITSTGGTTPSIDLVSGVIADTSQRTGGISTITVDTYGRVTAVTGGGNYQAALGFTPVQQGGGTNQTTNKIYIGWSAGSVLRLQVDSTDFGASWPINITGSAGSATSAGTFTSTTQNSQFNSIGIGQSASGTAGEIRASTISDSIGNIRKVPVDNKTSGYTLTATDIGKTISITTGGIAIPANVFGAGDIVTIFNNSGSSQAITTTGVTCYLSGTSATGDRTVLLRGVVNILCVASNVFVVSGSGLT